MWISAIVTLLNLALAATIGVRLVWRARGGVQGPELWLAGYFLLAAFLGSMLSISVYSSLGGNGFSIDPEVASRLLAASTGASSIGAICVYAFTWRTFRAEAGWARALVLGATLAFATTWTYQLATGAFVVVVFPGPAYWLQRGVYCGAFAWVGIESLRYFNRLQRRLRIGLADAVVTHRFWLWGMWAAVTFVLSLSELCARVAYVWTTGETRVVLVDQAMPIIYVTVAATALLGGIAATCLWLTFFPTRPYVGWVMSHYARISDSV